MHFIPKDPQSLLPLFHLMMSAGCQDFGYMFADQCNQSKKLKTYGYCLVRLAINLHIRQIQHMQLILVVSYLKSEIQLDATSKMETESQYNTNKSSAKFQLNLPSALVIISDKLMVSYPHAGEG